MTINVYERIKDENGNPIAGRTMLFIPSDEVDDEDNINGFISGVGAVVSRTGHTFIVDDYLIDQTHKLKIINGELVVKDGETLDVPEKTPEEIEREQLLARLAELDGA